MGKFGKFEIILACSVIISAIFISVFIPLLVKPQITPIGSISPTPSDLSAWKLHKNEKYNYEFKYPPAWNFRPDVEYSVLESSPVQYTFPEYAISIQVRDKYFATFDQQATKYSRCVGNCPEEGDGSSRKEGIDYQEVSPTVEIKSSPNLAKYFQITTAFNEKIFLIPHPNSKQYVELWPGTWPNRNNYELFDLILSTFRFSDPSETSVKEDKFTDSQTVCNKDEDCSCFYCQRVIDKSALNENTLNKECPLYSKQSPEPPASCAWDGCYGYEKNYIPKCINGSCVWKKR